MKCRNYGQRNYHNYGLLVAVLVFFLTITYVYIKKLPVKTTIGSYQLQIAATSKERAKGFQGVHHIPKRTGILFVYPIPTKAIYWMYRCYTGIDIVFLDINGKVQGITSAMPTTDKKLPPEQYPRYTVYGPIDAHKITHTSLPKTAYVIEVPLGEGVDFSKTSAHLVPHSIKTLGINAS